MAFRRRLEAESWILLAMEELGLSPRCCCCVGGWPGVWGVSEEESCCASFSFLRDMAMENGDIRQKMQEIAQMNGMRVKPRELVDTAL